MFCRCRKEQVYVTYDCNRSGVEKSRHQELPEGKRRREYSADTFSYDHKIAGEVVKNLTTLIERPVWPALQSGISAKQAE